MSVTLKPIKDADEASFTRAERDKATREVDAPFPIAKLENLVGDCEAQPSWRGRADLNCAYYDGKQIDEMTAAQYLAEGIDAKPTNLVARVVNGVLGQEERNRTDVTVQADADEVADVCAVSNQAMKEAQRETYADLAVSNAYASQVKAGIGWVEVQRNADLLLYPYRVDDIHRNEIWWDWRAKHVLLRDARWMCRKRWEDADMLSAAFPKFKDFFRNCVSGWSDTPWLDMDDDAMVPWNNRRSATSLLEDAWSLSRSFRVRGSEWVDTARKRVKLYEVWYKVPAVAVVMRIGVTQTVLYDQENPLHVEAVARGLVKVAKTVTYQLRKALYAGPYRISDVGTTKREFPYIPFIAFRDDVDYTPYGLIDGMRSPQDEYNERRLRIRWLLKANQVFVDDDALNETYNSYKDLANDARRPDMMLILRAQRRQAAGVTVQSNFQMQREQLEAMQDAKQLIQDVPGVYSTQLGNAPAGVTSGIAIGSLVEQGLVSMGELNGNYRHARRAVFEHLLELIVEDHIERDMQVLVGSGENRKTIVLNTVDAQGMPINQMRDAPVRVGLGDMPSTPAFKLQQQQQIGDIIRALAGNPAAVAALTPGFIEATDIPDRREIADTVRRASGIPTAQDKQAQEAAAKEAAATAKRQTDLAERTQEADVRGKEAKAILDQSKAVEIQQRIGITNQQVEGQLPDPAANDPEAQLDAAVQESIAEASTAPA